MKRSNRLAVLASEIRAAHEEMRRSSAASAEAAYTAGERLAEAKAREDIPRGGWERWVEDVAGVPRQTARHYLRLFNAIEEGSLTLADIAEAGQIGALKAAREAREGSSENEESEWTEDQSNRKEAVERGECVVANMHEGADRALIRWAEANGCFVRIDRKTEWGNPFEMPDDGDRAEVVGKFSKFYLPYKDGLLSRIRTLRGKVLGCWCHPEECHGHIIAEIVNREAAGENTAENLADQLAEIDG